MALVPSHIVIGEAAFPLDAYDHGVRLAEGVRGLGPLGYLVERLLVKRRGAERIREFVDREDFGESELYASVVQPTDTLLDHGDSLINWMRLAGRLPDLTDAYRVGTTFLDESLAIPRATLIQLIEQLGELNDGVLAGRLEPRIDTLQSTLQPAPRSPVTPEVAAQIAEYDRLAAIGRDLAENFVEQLLLGGTPRIAAPPSTERTAELRAELLAEIEAMAAGLEAIDRSARGGAEPYADERLDAQIAARRRRLLFELDAAGVFAADAALRARLVALALPNLVAYHDAAMALRRYLASPARARLVRTPPPAELLDCEVSLDWFRAPTRYVPEHDSPAEWLAVCEQNFARNPPAGPRAGRRFVRLEGRMHQLLYRLEAGAAPRLWRALPEPGAAEDHPPTPAIPAPDAEPAEFPLGRELDDGSYRITEHLWGTPDRGCYRGLRLLDGEPVLITLGTPQVRSRQQLCDALALAGPMLAPLRGVGELVEANQSPLSVMLEDAPPGAPLASLAFPLPLGDAVGLGVALARVVKQVHAHQRIIRGIRPELVYVDAERSLTGLAPRCERFWSLAPTPGYGVAPCFDEIYLAPEIIAGREAVPASDVFSLCALLARVASGRHPFASPSLSMMSQITAIATGARVPWTGPASLAAILDAGLAVDPAKRPTPARLIDLLENTRPS